MKHAIIYSSHTGNTKQLAQQIRNYFQHDECVYDGLPTKESINVDIQFIGFWTDKGTCDGIMQNYIKQIRNQKVFLFGTAGFGGSSQYFERILNNVLTYFDLSNQCIGTYMCQGKMPMSIRERYVKLAQENPKKFLPLIENFDQALSHPDVNDFQSLKQKLQLLTK